MTGNDAFFSYAHADNIAHGGFIKTVHGLLIDRIAARLKIWESRLQDVERKLQFFIDYEGLPANGEVENELIQQVCHSEFLFIFVGDGYLRSPYRLKERDWFRRSFANEKTANERTFMLFLTSEALLAASEGSLAQMRSKVIWLPLIDSKTKGPLEPYLQGPRFSAVENPELGAILDRIADTYVERYREAVAQPVSGSPLIEALERRLNEVEAPTALSAQKPPRIFISYRRDDSAGHAGRLHDRLEREFGRDLLFMDVDAIPLGADFAKVLGEEVVKCDVLLAIIGPGWLDVRDEAGQRRLDDLHDFVHIEIAAALKRDIPVIPILLEGTRVPKADQLPDDLKGLVLRNGLDVRHASFHNDMDKLIRGLRDRKPAQQSAATLFPWKPAR